MFQNNFVLNLENIVLYFISLVIGITIFHI